MLLTRKDSTTMRTLDNALSDTLAYFVAHLDARILPDPDLETRWRIQVEDRQTPGSLLEVEILNLNGEAVGCVLQRTQIPFRTMRRFMNRLMDALDDGGSPPGGSPRAS
jgi:hypothetical protein